MRRFKYIVLCIWWLLCACQPEADWAPERGAITEGMVTFAITPEATTDVLTKADADEVIENVTLLIFDGNGDEITRVYQELVGNNSSVSVYLEAREQTIYALCNWPDPTALDAITTEAELQEAYYRFTEQEGAEGAFQGSYMMSGRLDITPSGGTIEEYYELTVRRLAAKLTFNIYFDPEEEGDQFSLSGAYLHNIPAGSKIMEQEKPAFETDENSLNINDYVFDTLNGEREDRYYQYGDSVWLNLTEESEAGPGTGIMTTYHTVTFHTFENRQGSVVDDPTIWPDLEGLRTTDEEAYKYYRQLYKRKLALEHKRTYHISETETQEETGFAFATYLSIHGVYQTAQGINYEVHYYVYLGEDNYRDFNIRRNHHYTYRITIKSVTEADTRVLASDLTELKAFGNWEETLDAHCNAIQVLMYAPGNWEVEVEEPDAHPWLEVSTSSVYKPRIFGESGADKAGFRLSGGRGLHYFYIHTDEFVPKIAVNEGNPDNNNPSDIREGAIICRSGDQELRLPIQQYAAQMIILSGYDPHHPLQPIADTFYVERKLERKNIAWGFDSYWSYITDDLIASGQWDGLSNTRKLYQVAMDGDKWGVEPAYPAESYPNGIPDDIALGYALEKNRDRNGNGVIDYDEILWYLPAVNELERLSESLEALEGQGKVELDEDSGNFHTSTPSSADPAGVTTGFSYYVNLRKGKYGIGLRTNRYNVICARRASGWLGPETGNVSGDVTVDKDWNEEEEEIMPKDL